MRPSANVRTPFPPFDVEVFAADSECRIRACAEAERRPTAAPPPFHPSLVPNEARAHFDRSNDPTLLDCARRANLTRAQLRVGGISRQEAIQVLRAELGRVEELGGSDALRQLATSLGAAVAELAGIVEEEPLSERSILLIEDDIEVRDKLTLALEALGQRVRTATGAEALTELAAHETSAILIGVDAGRGSEAFQMLRSLLPLEGVAILVGAKEAGANVEALAAEALADDFVRFDREVNELVDDLGTILTALGLTR